MPSDSLTARPSEGKPPVHYRCQECGGELSQTHVGRALARAGTSFHEARKTIGRVGIWTRLCRGAPIPPRYRGEYEAIAAHLGLRMAQLDQPWAGPDVGPTRAELAEALRATLPHLARSGSEGVEAVEDMIHGMLELGGWE